jgi:hypothetical protein
MKFTVTRRTLRERCFALGLGLFTALALAPAAHAQLVGDSFKEFSGVQGQNNWNHGYYHADGDGYQVADFNPFLPGVPGGPGDTTGRFGFNGAYDYFDGAGAAQNPPWTFMSNIDIHPDSFNQPLGELWPIRRYTVQAADVASGGLAVMWRTRKTNLNGDGVTGKLFVNGVEIGSTAIKGNDGVGFMRGAYVAASPGDVIDLAYTPLGPTGDVFDGADGGQNMLKIRGNAAPFAAYTPAAVPLLSGFGGVHADSVAEFSGNQGQNNWYYGIYNKTVDSAGGDPGYQDYDFIDFQPGVPTGADAPRFGFNGIWDYVGPGGPINPPWTEINANGGHPNGNNNAGTVGSHWAVRRYVSEVTGPVTISGMLSTSAACGDGTTPRIFVNGTQIFSQNVFGSGGNYQVDTNLNAGDFVDFAIDSGPSGDDPCDGTVFTAKVSDKVTVTQLANSVTDFAGTQGAHGWTYGSWDRKRDEEINANGDGVYAPNEFQAFAPGVFNGSVWDVALNTSPWTELNPTGGHPAGSNGGDGDVVWPIRRWTAPNNMTVNVQGSLFNPGVHDGTVGRIFVDGAEVWNALTDGNRVDYNLFFNVHAGSQIDFAIDPGFADYDFNDMTEFTAAISTNVPEPSSIALSLLGAASLAVLRLRRRRA